MSRARCLNLVRKIVKNVGLDLVRTLHGAVDFLQHDRLRLRLVQRHSGSATPSWPPRLVKNRF